MVEPSSETGVLGPFHVREAAAKPFAYFVVDDVLECAHADSLLAWLESCRWWELVHTQFYDQYEFMVCEGKRRMDLPKECKPLFTQAALGELAALVGEHLGTARCLILRVVAHMLKPGQGIGIHNDDKANGAADIPFRSAAQPQLRRSGRRAAGPVRRPRPRPRDPHRPPVAQYGLRIRHWVGLATCSQRSPSREPLYVGLYLYGLKHRRDEAQSHPTR